MYEEIRQKIFDLLQENANDMLKEHELSRRISNKCFEMGHLYTDMGLESRAQMNALMQEHYTSLAKKRPVEIRWKKFLFDTIGEVAPACYECRDSNNCFKCDVLEQSK